MRLESWVDPKITGADDEVTVYGINSGQNLVIYNKSMFELGIYGDRETGAAKLNKPWGVAANSKGDVFVTDMGNNRVVKMFNPKSDLRYVSSWGSQGSTNEQFNQPRGIALIIMERFMLLTSSITGYKFLARTASISGQFSVCSVRLRLR